MPPKKCFSTCQKKIKNDCVEPECKYVNGKKYSYCRLGNNYKMDENCVPILKTTTRRNKKQTINKTTEMTRSSSNFKPTKEEIDAFKKKVASKKIGNFLKKNITKRKAMKKIGRFLKNVNPNKRRAYFLKSVCSDSGVCIAFGKESLVIKKHFKDFSDFSYLSADAKTIGSESANGFVKELTYTNEGYVANAILKSSKKNTADNLLYEGLVGNFLNRMGLIYPCFLETYGTYKYSQDVAYFMMKISKNSPPGILETGLTLIKDITKDDLKMACITPVAIAALTQHLKDAKSLRDCLSVNTFLYYDLTTTLFQIYQTLSKLGDNFTHYDLHLSNILLYEPVKGHCIEYHYHLADKVISFKSKFITKIIDYGRCYFNDVENHSFTGNSKKIYDELCKIKECAKCGNNSGFQWLEYNKKNPANDYYISSQILNKSHDLLPLKRIRKLPKHLLDNMPSDLTQMLKKVVFSGVYGTKELKTSGLPSKINNVDDAAIVLSNIVSSNFFISENTRRYNIYTKLGDLHVYNDGRPMNYIPA